MESKTLPQSEHFTLHELADRVWAAIAKPDGLAASNSGIVDIGDRTLVFDTTLSPTSAADLRRAAEHLTGRNVSCVLTSHADRDHVFGNSAFSPETEIHATTRTREFMAETTSSDITDFKKQWPDLQRQWIESAKTAGDEAEKLDYEDGVRFAQKIIDTFPQLEARLPDHTFNDQMEFKGSKRVAKFITFGGGHTDSDAILHLPAERIIFTGDLLVVKKHPGLSKSHPHEWLRILAKIKSLDPLCLIPGHGEPGTLADVILIERYLNETLNLAEQNWLEGSTAALRPPAFTDGWGNLESFEVNMKFLQKFVQGKNQ